MQIDFRKMMAEGVEWYDPTIQGVVVSGTPSPQSVQQYYFTDKITRVRVVYTVPPESFVIRSIKHHDGSSVSNARTAYRAIVNRFLETVPSSLPHFRMTALKEFLGELQYSFSSGLSVSRESFLRECGRFNEKYSEILGEYQYKKVSAYGFRKPSFFKHYDTSPTPILRKDRFSARERMYLRTTKGTSSKPWKLGAFVGAWHQSCGSLTRDGSPRHSSSREGWTYFYDKQQINVYNKSGHVTKEISLKGIDINDDNVIPVYGINNCFCAAIEEVIGETYCIRLLNRNLNFYGYICVDERVEGNSRGVSKRAACLHFESGTSNLLLRARMKCEDLIATTKTKALARMLATS
jgi:hypothetical protein